MNWMTVAAGLSVLALANNGARADAGESIYQQCAACHQPGGVGIPGMFPPLRNRLARIAATPEGREYAAMVLIGGLVGTIGIDGQRYLGAMPAQGLSDAKIAEVFNYIITDFAEPGAADKTEKFTAAEVARIRARNGGEHSQSALTLRSKIPDL